MACWKRSIDEATIDSVVADITTRLSLLPQNEVESQYIGELVMKLLKKIDEVAYVRFASVYRHFQDADAFIDEVQNMQAENKAAEPESDNSKEAPVNETGQDGKTA